MGNGLNERVVTTLLTSLKKMFSTDLDVTKNKYKKLTDTFLYPNLLDFTTSTDRRVWRKQTLRHAGFLLTSDVNFFTDHGQYPAKDFAKWLKWLTWVQNAPGNVTIQEGPNTLTNTETPAQAIMGTLKSALTDPAHHAVDFLWSETATNQLLTVNVNRTPGSYKIEVISITATDQRIGVVGDDDEDQSLPYPPIPI